MPRTTQQILDHADELAARFEQHEPVNPRDAVALRAVRFAALARADIERELVGAVTQARSAGHSWASIGAMLGTSGEAARQRYRQASPASRDQAIPPFGSVVHVLHQRAET